MQVIYIFQNYGAFFDEQGAGITGPVKLKGSANGTVVDLSSQLWNYQVSFLCSLQCAAVHLTTCGTVLNRRDCLILLYINSCLFYIKISAGFYNLS